MSFPHRLLVALAGATGLLALPTVASATITHVDVAPVPSRTTQSTATTWRTYQTARPGRAFSLAAASWKGAGAVEIRAVRTNGTRTAWIQLDGVDGPSPVAGRTYSEPVWAGDSTAVEIRGRGAVAGLRIAAIDPGPNPDGVVRPLTGTALGGVPRPAIVSRAGWGANEALRRNAPAHASRIRFAIVHHTDGPNDYSRAQAPSIVRGVYEYHVSDLGWSDIGYNALVDRFGTIYEGRYGGIDRNVVGAHALGFNTGSFGVSLMGTFESPGQNPPPAMLDGLERLLAWRLDLAHIDPTGSVRVVSGGNERYAAGKAVVLRTVSGHRDTGYTDCPGQNVYDLLPRIRADLAGLARLRIWSPALAPGRIAADTPIRFTAQLSAPAAWRVDVLGAGDQVVASGRGSGTAVDWTWTPSANAALGAASLTWRISAGAGSSIARPAAGRFDGRGAVGGDPTPAVPVEDPLEDLVAAPAVIATNSRGELPAGTVTWRQTVDGTVAVAVETSGGTRVGTLQRARRGVAGATGSTTWDVAAAATPVASGSYRYRIVLTPTTGAKFTAIVPIDVRREIALFDSSLRISPGTASRLSDLVTRIARKHAGSVTLELRRGARRLRVLAGNLRVTSTAVVLRWDVSDLPDGAYGVAALAAGTGGTQQLVRRFTVDRKPPTLAIEDERVSHGKVLFRLRASEAGSVRFRGSTGTILIREVPAGVTTIAIARRTLLPVTNLRIGIRDLADNAGSARRATRVW